MKVKDVTITPLLDLSSEIKANLGRHECGFVV